MSSKQREALEQICELLSIGGKPDTAMCIRYEAAFQIAKEALAEPPRNCDVGTAEEQAKRFKNYCRNKVCKRNVCHSYGYEELFHHKCFPIWAQMPYEAKESEVKE